MIRSTSINTGGGLGANPSLAVQKSHLQIHVNKEYAGAWGTRLKKGMNGTGAVVTDDMAGGYLKQIKVSAYIGKNFYSYNYEILRVNNDTMTVIASGTIGTSILRFFTLTHNVMVSVSENDAYVFNLITDHDGISSDSANFMSATLYFEKTVTVGNNIGVQGFYATEEEAVLNGVSDGEVWVLNSDSLLGAKGTVMYKGDTI